MIAAFAALPLAAQTQEETLEIYTEHPRLFLRPGRLRLLQRERERRSMRWLQIETFVAGKAPLPERAFALALFYRAAQDKDAGAQAIAWALTRARENSPADLRQIALVFDWCQDLLSASQSAALTAKLQKGISALSRDQGVQAVRSRLLAAVVLAGHAPEASRREMENIVRGWWQARIAPALKSGRNVVPREDMYALMEILHAVRDNVNIDLRDGARAFFKDLPLFLLVSYYPASYPAGENDYRIPAAHGAGEPDLTRAALARAAELSLVAYDVNAFETQVVQGWLMHDRFLLRGTFGIVYEFLWANPYQPGLSYYHVPLVLHDSLNGRLFVRSSWDESATWLGYFDGELQLFRDGRVTLMRPELTAGPLALTSAVVYFGNNARKFRTLLQEDEHVFIIGLKPKQKYDIEVDGEELRELATDIGGILELPLPREVEVGVRLKETPARH